MTIHHYFEIPDIRMETLENELYRKVPWAISKSNNNWCYQGITANNQLLHKFAVFSDDYTDAKIYNLPDEVENIQKNGWHSLSLFPTDQIWLAPLLADRKAAILHSAGVIINWKGLIFVGHSSAGKTTTVRLLRKAVKNIMICYFHLKYYAMIETSFGVGRRDGGCTVPGVMEILQKSPLPLHHFMQ